MVITPFYRQSIDYGQRSGWILTNAGNHLPQRVRNFILTSGFTFLSMTVAPAVGAVYHLGKTIQHLFHQEQIWMQHFRAAIEDAVFCSLATYSLFTIIKSCMTSSSITAAIIRIFSGLLTITVPKQIASYYDPEGNRFNRSVFHRFVTITLPDNGCYGLFVWISNIQNPSIAQLFDPEIICVITTMTCATAVLIDVARFCAAWVIDRAATSLESTDLQRLALIIGPRDFYARPLA